MSDLNVSFGSRKSIALTVLTYFATSMMVLSIFVTTAGTEPTTPAISAGSVHSLALKGDGTAWA